MKWIYKRKNPSSRSVGITEHSMILYNITYETVKKLSTPETKFHQMNLWAVFSAWSHGGVRGAVDTAKHSL